MSSSVLTLVLINACLITPKPQSGAFGVASNKEVDPERGVELVFNLPQHPASNSFCFAHCNCHNEDPRLFLQHRSCWRNNACSWWLHCPPCLMTCPPSLIRKSTCFGRPSQETPKRPHFRRVRKYRTLAQAGGGLRESASKKERGGEH